MNKRIMEIGSRRVTVFSGDDATDGSGTIIYMHMDMKDMEQLVIKLEGLPTILVAIDQVDWNRDLSPWPAKRAFRGGEDFGGGADAYLKELTEIIVPAVEADLRLVPSCRILGVSSDTPVPVNALGIGEYRSR